MNGPNGPVVVKRIGWDDGSTEATALELFYSGSGSFVCAGCGERTFLEWDPGEWPGFEPWAAVQRAVYGDPPRCFECRRPPT